MLPHSWRYARGGKPVERTIAYVDGFNLYHGMRQITGRRYLWLDLEALCGQLLHSDHQLRKVTYFTARVRNNLASEQRQDTHLQALSAHCATVEITEGRFQRQTRRCRSCSVQWYTYEEKESDVNIAISLVEDAALGRFDRALVISGDSDLVPAIRAAKRLAPDTRVVAVFPPRRVSDPLRAVADAEYYLGKDKLRKAQLPDEVVTPNGIKLTRPAYWS
jgi:uncharacterized LabA/DUF88 family protein